MPEYDQKKVRSLIASASAHRMHPGGELAMQLADQLQAVDETISATLRAATDAQNLERRARADLQVANEELKVAREQVVPLARFTEALKEIALNAKGKIKTVALTVLKDAGIEMEVQPPAPTPPPA